MGLGTVKKSITTLPSIFFFYNNNPSKWFYSLHTGCNEQFLIDTTFAGGIIIIIFWFLIKLIVLSMKCLMNPNKFMINKKMLLMFFCRQSVAFTKSIHLGLFRHAQNVIRNRFVFKMGVMFHFWQDVSWFVVLLVIF